MDEDIEPIIRVEGLYKVFGPKPAAGVSLARQGRSKAEVLQTTGSTIAVSDAAFTVNPGEIFVIMGLSGSGKSTLLRCLNRLIKPTAGRVILDGQDVTALTRRELIQLRRQRFAMVFQHFALLPHRTVVANVEYGLEVNGMDAGQRRKKSLQALETVGLGEWAEHYPSELSGGMQQRVGLARALATDADVLLMDEAFSALDPLIRQEMQEELLQLQAKLQRTIIFITHDLGEALKLGDRIAIMRDGAIVQIDRPEGILARPADDYVESFTEDVDRGKVFTASNVMSRPRALRDNVGPRVALRRMRELELSTVFVVDRNRRLKGIVEADDVVEAARRREDTLTGIIRDHIPTCSPDTSLRDLAPLATEHRIPVAVVNDEHQLVGHVARVQVLAGMAGNIKLPPDGTITAGSGSPDSPGGSILLME